MKISLLKIFISCMILIQFGCVSTKDAKPKTDSRYPASSSTPTASAPSFTAVADMSTSEGVNVKSSALKCGASGDKVRYAIVSQELSFANCSITSDNTKVSCTPEYRILHSSWSSKVKVKCTVSNKDSYSEFKLTVADTNRSPALKDISDQTAFAESAFTAINANDDTDDYDADYDPLVYSCSFTGGTFTTATDCEDLPGTNSFSATTGILNWTPSLSAIDSGDDTDYSITISASDSLGGTDSKTFTLTVAIVAAPTYGSFNPASPSSTSTSPVITGTASSDTSTVSFYSDSTCATRIGTGSKSEFTGSGITLSVSTNATTSIYAKAYDASLHSSLCTSLTTFTHDNTPPAVPTFTSTNPTSPNNSSTSPLVIGSSDSDTATIKLFSNSSCSVQIGSGTKADFEGTGITATVSSNATTTIYARAYDSLSNASNCTSLTSYTHDNTGPTAPSFSSSNPSSPTNSSTTPLIIGSSSSDTATIKFYTDAACSSSVIGTGTKSSFEGSGIQATVTANATTTIYALAYDSLSNASTCTSMLSFVHDSTAPTVPTFSSTNPASPSSSSTTPTIIGSASADTVTLNIYSDSNCSTLIGSGSKATFEAAGISLSVSANTTTSIYAKAYDSLSNATACTSLTTYIHDNTAPTAPTFTSTNPVSPSASNITPTIIGSASADTSTLNIYDDASCTNLIGNGSKATFEGAGISVTVTANTTSTIYAKAYDSLSNATSCTTLTTYKHDNTGPTAPSFSSSNPTTPSSSSSTPLIIGSSSSDTATLNFYTDAACSSSVIGTGTKAEFEGSGIQATVTTNATTTIYAKAYDSLSNASTCTSMLSFVHDSTAPTVPTFSSTNPASPSSSSTTPTIIGSASADTVTLNIYSNAGCTTQVGTGSKATFEAAGISLTVSANSTTTLYAKAYDSLSNATACTSMTSYTHDNTIPSTVTSLTDGTYYSSITSSPSLSWTASSDSGAGILRYEVSLGSSAGATDIVSWTDVGVTTSYQFTGITPNLVNGNTYYANVRVIDNAANTSSVTSSDGWTVDTSAPSDITVTFTGCTTNYLGATWTTSTDSESGISKYEYALGTTNGGTDVISWTSNANSTSLSLASLNLTAGNTYYLSARAVNNASTTSSTNTQSAVCTNLTTGLTAFWDMDENSGDRIDSLGTNDLTDNNTVTATGGRVDNSAVFDSANSEYLSSITNSDLETGDIDFTLSFWVYLTDNSVSTPFINKWGGTTNEFSVEWVNSGDIRFKVGTGTVNYSTSLNNNTWYHIVAYHDATNNLIGISLNGGTATTAAHATGNSVGDSNFYIGRDSGGTTYFTGRIDAVGFWKKVLTSYERKVLYNSGSGRENPF